MGNSQNRQQEQASPKNAPKVKEKPTYTYKDKPVEGWSLSDVKAWLQLSEPPVTLSGDICQFLEDYSIDGEGLINFPVSSLVEILKSRKIENENFLKKFEQKQQVRFSEMTNILWKKESNKWR